MSSANTILVPIFTYDDDLYSDFYKDAYGYRPTHTRWTLMTPAEKQVEWDLVCNAAEDALADEAIAEKRAIEAFETQISDTIKVGAGDRETALRWLGGPSEDDEDYFCYCNGLPYGYFRPTVETYPNER